MKRNNWLLLRCGSAKSIRRTALLGLLVAGLLLVLAGPASAQGFSITITVDENGNGRFTNTAGFTSALPFSVTADPGPGGAPNALTYDLLNPPGLTAGDLILLEPGTSTISDVIRFNPNAVGAGGGTGTLVFYSSAGDGVDSLADAALVPGGAPGVPSALYANNLAAFEVGPEGLNGFTYTPTQGQPGFVAGAGGPITYVIQSDTPAVPEPATVTLLGIGAVGLIGHGWRRRGVRHAA
jgi:hypothetical protein